MSKFKACIYLRLSKEDEKSGTSESIINQRKIISNFVINREDIEILYEKIDDGHTGVDFNRKGFNEMMELVKKGKINCIIVKDLSRFSRNYSEGGEYIEKIFPYLNIRFISINDNIDNIDDNGMNNITIPTLNLINQKVSEDISRKTRSTLDMLKKEGKFTGAFAVYGYIKSENNELIVDELPARIIKEIYEYKIQGYSNSAIADKLNSLGVLSPYEYKKSIGLNYHTGFKKSNKVLWSSIAIKRILENEYYIGSTVQGKQSRISYKVRKRIEKCKNDWIVVKDTHKPIIEMKDYLLVQRLLKKDMRVSPSSESICKYSGLLYCNECGEMMVRKPVKANGKSYVYYVCNTHKQTKDCSMHNTSESKIEKSIQNILQIGIHTLVNKESIIDILNGNKIKEKKIKDIYFSIEEIEKRISDYNDKRFRLYDDYKSGLLEEDEFVSYKETYSNRIDESQQSINNLLNSLEEVKIINHTEHFAKLYDEYCNNKNLSRNLIIKLIEKIIVDEDKNLKVILNYQDEFDLIKKYLNLKEVVNG